jgi:proline-specific peptidase
MLPHAKFAETRGIPVIFYDQIGIGNSLHLTHKPKSIWTPKIFMDKLDNLLEKLGIASHFDMIGHSWGGMLAVEYVGSRKPKGLRRLIIAGASPSIKHWMDGCKKLLESFPEEMRRTIEKHEREDTTDHPDYQNAMQVFYAKHICQLEPWPQQLSNSFAAMAEEPVIYSSMRVPLLYLWSSTFLIWHCSRFGVSEFYITGSLEDWDATSLLLNITNTTLILNGWDDGATDASQEAFFKGIPKSKWLQFGKSSHTYMFEEPEKYLKVVGDFLTD